MEKMTIAVSTKMLAYLRRLLQSGLYGESVEQVAVRLIAKGIEMHLAVGHLLAKPAK